MLPSAGDTYKVVNSDGTSQVVNINVPEWYKGPNANENVEWMKRISTAVCTEIENICEYLITIVRNIHSRLFRVVAIFGAVGMT